MFIRLGTESLGLQGLEGVLDVHAEGMWDWSRSLTDWSIAGLDGLILKLAAGHAVERRIDRGLSVRWGPLLLLHDSDLSLLVWAV